MERKARKNPRLARDSEILDIFYDADADADDWCYAMEENEMDSGLLKVGNHNQEQKINIQTAIGPLQPNDNMVISIDHISRQDPGNCDPKESIVTFYDPEIQHKRHNEFNEVDVQMKQFNFDEPSTSKLVQFGEDISNGIIFENEENIDQESSNENNRPMPILYSKWQNNKENLSEMKGVRFNLFPTYKIIPKCTNNIVCVSNDESDPSVDIQITKSDNNLCEEPDSSYELDIDDNSHFSHNEIKISDAKKTYFDVKLDMDIRELQCKVRLKNPQSFKDYLRNQVHDIKLSTVEGQSDHFIEVLIEKLCSRKFIHGDCENKGCQLLHTLPSRWCYELNDSQRLALATSVLNYCNPPSIRLGELILNWLVKQHQSTYEVLYISESFLCFDDKTHKTIWRVILNSLVACGLEEWEAVSWILVYYHNHCNTNIIAALIDYLDIENRYYSKYWKSFRPLTQLGFFLTEGIMKQMLTQMCTAPNKVDNFSKGAILYINEQVECLDLGSTFRLAPLIKDFVHIQNMILKNVHPLIPVKYEIFPLLKQALDIEDAPRLAELVIDFSKTVRYEQALSKLFFQLIPHDRLCYLTNAIIQEINKSYVEKKHAILFIGRVCVEFINLFVKSADWKSACDLLLVLKKSGINPITIQPLYCASSEVNIALVCSKIYLYNEHYKSSIMVLTDNNLLADDPTAWKIKGTLCELQSIVDHVCSLMRTFNSNKNIDESRLLFSKILTSQKNMRTPIDLVEFYEPLLCNMLSQVKKYKDVIIPFYEVVESIDSTIMLTEFSYRALLVLFYNKKQFRCAKDMSKKAINCCAYFPYNKKENVMYIAPYMVEEEMKVYLLEWVYRYYQNTKCQKVEVYVKFVGPKSHHSKDYNSLVSPILSLKDYSVSAAINRFIDGLNSMLNTTVPRPINEKTNSFKLSVELQKRLLYVNKMKSLEKPRTT